MKYLRLIYIDQDKPGEALARESRGAAHGVEGTGECLAEAFKRLPTGVRSGKLSVSDGPFLETKG